MARRSAGDQRRHKCKQIMMIRKLNQDEWSLRRDLVLESLQKDPDAFSASYEEAKHQPDRYWRGIARKAGEAAFAAYNRDDPCGICIVSLNAGVRLGHLWVRLGERDQGVGRKLLETAESWAGDGRAGRISLSVAEGTPAVRFYRQAGYRETGDRFENMIEMMKEISTEKPGERPRRSSCR